MGLLKWFERRSYVWIMTFAFAWTAAIGALDYLTGYEISVGAFYLVGIVVTAWCCGAGWGWVVVLVAAAAWFEAEAGGRPEGHSKVFVYWNTFVRLCYFLPVMYLTANLRLRLIREEQSARTDLLTGAHNTRSFFERFELELARHRRNHEPLTLAYMDLDNFKQVNDTLGHGRGDRLLREVVSLLCLNLRPTDVVGRVGGDEFVVLMPMVNGEQARTAVSRLSERLLEAMRRDDVPVTFSLGVVSFEKAPESCEEAVRLADGLMYKAKQAGKNRVEYEVHTSAQAAG